MMARIHIAECGCQVQAFEGEYSFLWCPLHKAAKDMYEALRKVRTNIGHIIMTRADAILVDQIDKALAKVENKARIERMK